MGIVEKAMDKVMGSNVEVLNGDFFKTSVDFCSDLIHINTLIKSDS